MLYLHPTFKDYKMLQLIIKLVYKDLLCLMDIIGNLEAEAMA